MYGPWGYFPFWQLIVLVLFFSFIFRPRGNRRADRAFDDFNERHLKDKEIYEEALDAAEDKIEDLEDRIRVLEKIITDTHKSQTLADEIESLRKKA